MSRGHCLVPFSQRVEKFDGGSQAAAHGLDARVAVVTGAGGGAAEAAGFTLSSSSTTVIGFSLTGATIAAGDGVLVTLDVTGDGNACLVDLIISDSSGNENIGIVFGDYKVQFDQKRIMEKKDNITTPKSTREDKSY